MALQRRRAAICRTATLLTVTLLTAILLTSALLTSCAQTTPQLTTEQKLEDFRCMFDILKDNHPFLALKARVEGYDWLAHEEEFEKIIAGTRDDKEFAQAMEHILLLINNGHTTIMNADVYRMICSFPRELEPWLDEAAKTDEETVKRWFDMAIEPMGYPQGQTLPFRACYNQGEYLVYWVSEDIGPRLGISPGFVVSTVDGMDVHEFVASLRGKTQLRYDPYRKRVHMAEFLPPYTPGSYRIAFENSSGGVIEADVGFGRIAELVYPPMLPTNIWSLGGVNVYTTILAEGQVAYVHLRQMTQFESSRAERETLLSFFEEIRDVPALIIDIRNNGGGDDRFWMCNIVQPLATRPLVRFSGGAVRTGEYLKPFLKANQEFGKTLEGLTGQGGVVPKEEVTSVLTPEELQNLPPEILGPDFEAPYFSQVTIHPTGESPFGGRIYLLTGPKVFSSAEAFANFCRSSGWATIVGEHTGGDGVGGTPAMVTLPNSKIPVFFPSALGLNPDLTANEETHTAPDVLVEPDPEDVIDYVQALAAMKIFTGPDPAYDTVLRECLKLALQEAGVK